MIEILNSIQYERGISMKKLLTVSFILMLVTLMSFSSFASFPESTESVTVPYTGDSITVDAVKDAAYAACTELLMDEQNLESGFANSPQNTTGKAWVVWDGGYLYLYAEITDPNIDYSYDTDDINNYTWMKDMIGIMLDLDYNRTVDYEYSYENNGDHIIYLNGTCDGGLQGWHMTANGTELYKLVKFISKIDTANGVISYEMAIPLETGEVAVNAGMKIGMEITAIDAQNAERLGQLSWSPYGAEMYHYTHVCGTAILSEKPAAAAPETEAPAIDTAAQNTDAPAAAQTSDILCIALAAVLAGGLTIVSRKRH